MDKKLVAWARAIKARRRLRGPVLWLFTDAVRLPDPLPSAMLLPRGLCGMVLRHDGVPGRAALALRLAAICRERRLGLSIAGDWRLAARLGSGVHMRGGLGPTRRGRFRTASVHDLPALLRARRIGALAFLSPAFPTPSHPGALALGAVCWAALARKGGGQVLALGGVDGATVRRLHGAMMSGAGAIAALAAPHPPGALGVPGAAS